jgi:cellulose synthase/poly-beta-1,6-N-acetylglucosamine synthase-like glycosyltransferase
MDLRDTYPMIAGEPLFELLLTLGLVLLAISSINLIALMGARLIAPARRPRERLPERQDLPSVLVQIPLFNEGPLVERVLDAVTALDWPSDRLHIQVLDDSTDGFSLTLSQRAVADLRRRGFDVELLHRIKRTAFKAGALAAGLERSHAEFVAIFDADFAPPRDFLQRTVGVLLAQPGMAYVQARWDHVNREASLLTRTQARLLDAHFKVEQEARWRLGLPVPFNGTCGVWRHEAIKDAGGWDGDTLTEDLDLSLRARLRGWGSAFVNDLPVPGLLPVSPRAWRTQQFRWTKGFVQCFVKLMPRIWASPLLPRSQKILISLQIGQPLAFLVGATCMLLSFPFIAGAAVAGETLGFVAILTSVLGFAGPITFMAAAGASTSLRRTLVEIFTALFLTTGLLLSNARAGLEALIGYRSAFVRTPKGMVAKPSRTPFWPNGLLELATGLGLLSFVLVEEPVAVLYLSMVIGGLLGVGTLQFLDGRLLSKERGIGT